jgi:hypothetical protein
MPVERTRPWWEALSPRGDVIIGTVGKDAQGVAIGKNIAQKQVYGPVGEPRPDDRVNVEKAFAQLLTEMRRQAGVDAGLAWPSSR